MGRSGRRALLEGKTGKGETGRQEKVKGASGMERRPVWLEPRVKGESKVS